MGLETPLALLGLGAAILPFLAHRIRRRDLKPVPLPTFALLQKAEAHKRRSRGLTDLLLLLLRVGIVVAACIAIAAPYATARLSFGDGSIASAAIVIDDSMSMMRKHDGQTLLAAAIERARQALDSLPEGSELSLIAAGQRARVLLRRSMDLRLARLELERLPLQSVRATDLKGALKLAAQQLEGARHPRRRLLVLSDFANHVKLTAEDVRLDGVEVSLERIGGTEPSSNLYFTSVSALPDPGMKRQTSVAVELAASGEAPERVPLRITTGGRELASTTLQLAGGRARTVLQVPTPEPDGDPTATLKLEARDAIEADNSAGVLLRPSGAIEVMLVNGDPHPASDRDELYYALQALRQLPASEGSLALRAVDAAALGKYDLAQVDVVVLANAEAPAGESADRLSRFVREGGALLIAGGDRIDPHAYNAALGEIMPCRIRARAEGPGIGLKPPALSRLEPEGPSGLTQARARKRLMLDCESEVLLRFADGEPALAEAQVGRGKSALLAVSLDADDGDWPFRPGYLPLLARLLRDLAGAGSAIEGPVGAGATLNLAVPPAATQMEVVAPDGSRQRYTIEKGQTSVQYAATDLAGAYRVLAASARAPLADVARGAFVVETPREESELQPLPGIERLSSRAATGGHAAEIKRWLAPYFVLLFALLALLEGGLRLRSR